MAKRGQKYHPFVVELLRRMEGGELLAGVDLVFAVEGLKVARAKQRDRVAAQLLHLAKRFDDAGDVAGADRLLGVLLCALGEEHLLKVAASQQDLPPDALRRAVEEAKKPELTTGLAPPNGGGVGLRPKKR